MGELAVNEVHAGSGLVTTDTTAQNDISRAARTIVFDGGETSSAHLVIRNTLDSLQRLQVSSISGRACVNQVRTVVTANTAQSNGVHGLLDVSGSHGNTKDGRSNVSAVLPERPRSTINTAVCARRRRGRDHGSQTDQGFAAVGSTVTVKVNVNLVSQARLCNFNASSDQFDHLLFAAVLQHFWAANSHSVSIVLHRELSSRNGAIRADVDSLVTRIAVSKVRVRVVVENLLQDGRATRDSLDVAALFQAHQQCVVVGQVILSELGTALDSGCDNV